MCLIPQSANAGVVLIYQKLTLEVLQPSSGHITCQYSRLRFLHFMPHSAQHTELAREIRSPLWLGSDCFICFTTGNSQTSCLPLTSLVTRPFTNLQPSKLSCGLMCLPFVSCGFMCLPPVSCGLRCLPSGLMWAYMLAACRNLSTVYKELQQRSKRQQNLSAMAGDKVMQRAVMVSHMPLLVCGSIGIALADVLQTLHVVRLSQVCVVSCSGCDTMLAAIA